MDTEHIFKLARGYSFLARNIIGGKMVNAALDALAFMDYRMLVWLSIWHPDHDTRIRLLRKRGVHVGEHVFIDQGVWIEITAPQSVVIEDYTAIGFGAIVVAHDATVSHVIDLPVRIQETRLGYSSGVGMYSIVLPGVQIEEYGQTLAGSVVTKDVAAGTVVGGNPAEFKCNCEDIGLAWQADLHRRPDIYFDHANPWRPPSTPWDHLMTWRQDGIKVRPESDMRTGTPFDYVIDAKLAKEGK